MPAPVERCEPAFFVGGLTHVISSSPARASAQNIRPGQIPSRTPRAWLDTSEGVTVVGRALFSCPLAIPTGTRTRDVDSNSKQGALSQRSSRPCERCVCVPREPSRLRRGSRTPARHSRRSDRSHPPSGDDVTDPDEWPADRGAATRRAGFGDHWLLEFSTLIATPFPPLSVTWAGRAQFSATHCGLYCRSGCQGEADMMRGILWGSLVSVALWTGIVLIVLTLMRMVV